MTIHDGNDANVSVSTKTIAYGNRASNLRRTPSSRGSPITGPHSGPAASSVRIAALSSSQRLGSQSFMLALVAIDRVRDLVVGLPSMRIDLVIGS
jgi:hypothetical protein